MKIDRSTKSRIRVDVLLSVLLLVLCLAFAVIARFGLGSETIQLVFTLGVGYYFGNIISLLRIYYDKY